MRDSNWGNRTVLKNSLKNSLKKFDCRGETWAGDGEGHDMKELIFFFNDDRILNIITCWWEGTRGG